ncbi:MAG: S41 family peptidase [Candidatus Pacebacteria bacterium]|nr:S41 family peptidase [Candidatus Paceibacterota bacterium]
MKAYRSIAAFAAIIFVAAGSGFYWWHGKSAAAASVATATEYKTSQEASNVYVRFDMEAYDDIEGQYWQQVQDADMAKLFLASVQKAGQNLNAPAASNATLASSTREGVAQMLSAAFAGSSTTTQEQLALGTLQVALYNLAPTGRNNLLSSQAKQQLENTVNNVNPNNNLYDDLGIPQGSSEAAVAQAAAEKSAQLAATTSAQGKQELAQVQKAAATLTNPTAKAIYDQTGAEATVFTHVLNSHTLYIDISSVAPSTIAEVAAAIDSASTTPALDNLIIDVRGNIGGDLSFAQNFLALFFGPNEYAFDLYHQGNLQVQRTANIAKDPTTLQFKQIAVLTDSMTQSTAELSASALKHDHLAYTVGTTTRGWGSVEAIVPMQTVLDPSDTYALELVEYLTVRYDNLPIEGNGVAPDVDVNSSLWRSQLPNYFNSQYMINAIENEVTKAPLH